MEREDALCKKQHEKRQSNYLQDCNIQVSFDLVIKLSSLLEVY
jgi:hypothetical protein